MMMFTSEELGSAITNADNIELQERMEFRYSKKHVQSELLDFLMELDSNFLESPEFMDMVVKIRNFRMETYSYDSKNIRVAGIELPDDQLALEILTATLAVQEVTPVQGVCSRMAVPLHYDDRIDGIKTAADLFVETEGHFFELYLHDCWENNTGTMGIKTNIDLSPELQAFLDRLQYIPPMFCEPTPWVTNRGGGYLTFDESAILGGRNHHNQRISLDVLNMLQETPYMLNEYTMGLPEQPKAELDTYQKCLYFENHVEDSLMFYKQYRGKQFYFPYVYDKRGRFYSKGYHINPQGAPYKKASIDFAKKEIVSDTYVTVNPDTQEFSGLDYLKIDIANLFGMDKVTWNERLDWFNANEHQLGSLVNKADEQYMFYKAIHHYQDALDGIPTGHIAYMDATCSGLQMMATLTGCMNTAKMVNLTDPETRHCAYTSTAQEMNLHLYDDEKVDRALIKKPLMTHYYNKSTQPTLTETQLEVFQEVLAHSFEGAELAKSLSTQAWNPNALVHTWKLPDAHTSWVPVTEVIDTKIELDGLDHVSFNFRWDKNQPSDRTTSLCPNVIHSIDGYVAREMVRRCYLAGIQLCVIHDAFGAHPNNLNFVRQCYRDIMAEIAQMDLLEDILFQLTREHGHFQKLSNDLHKYITKSEYMIC